MAVVGTPSDNYRIDRMERDLHDLLLEVRALAQNFQAYQLTQPSLFVTRREYEEEYTYVRNELGYLQRKYLGVLIAGLLLLSSLVVALATEAIKH